MAIVPCIKILMLMIGYYITSGLCEIIADEKIVKIISSMGDTFKILLGMLVSVIVMQVIGVAIILKVVSVS